MPNDLRYAVRMLAHSRGFTLTAIVVLTLGIGATATMFSATNAVLLKPLPYPDPDRMVMVRETRAQAGFESTVVSAREYLDWARDSTVLRDATIVDYPGLGLAFDGGAVRLGTMRVSAEFFSLFGVQPIAGRAFGRDAEQPGSPDVVVIAHRVWQERFAGAADVVGRTVRLEGRPTTVIGILPPHFSFQGNVDLVVPARFTPQLLQERDHSFDVIARLAPGVTHRQAAAELGRDGDAAARPNRRRCASAHAGPVRRGRLRPAHRLREHRQSVAGARRRPAARNRHSRRAWRRTRAGDSAAVD
jgi:hypothetical protein